MDTEGVGKLKAIEAEKRKENLRKRGCSGLHNWSPQEFSTAVWAAVRAAAVEILIKK